MKWKKHKYNTIKDTKRSIGVNILYTLPQTYSLLKQRQSLKINPRIFPFFFHCFFTKPSSCAQYSWELNFKIKSILFYIQYGVYLLVFFIHHFNLIYIPFLLHKNQPNKKKSFDSPPTTTAEPSYNKCASIYTLYNSMWDFFIWFWRDLRWKTEENVWKKFVWSKKKNKNLHSIL